MIPAQKEELKGYGGIIDWDMITENTDSRLGHGACDNRFGYGDLLNRSEYGRHGNPELIDN